MDLPATMLDCRLQFQDDEACQAYRETIRWPNGFVCLRCQGTNASNVASRRLCQCATCRNQVSCNRRDYLSRDADPATEMVPGHLLPLARHKRGISALQLQRALGLGGYQTAWTMLHKLRSAPCIPPVCQ